MWNTSSKVKWNKIIIKNEYNFIFIKIIIYKGQILVYYYPF